MHEVPSGDAAGKDKARKKRIHTPESHEALLQRGGMGVKMTKRKLKAGAANPIRLFLILSLLPNPCRSQQTPENMDRREPSCN